MSEQPFEVSSNIDQGVDLLEGLTLECLICGQVVRHAVGEVVCVGELGWHRDNAQAMVRKEENEE